MNLMEFEEGEGKFAQFHARFAPAFGEQKGRVNSGARSCRGQRQRIDRSRDSLQGLLVQSAERRNAENLSEAVEGASARVLQRFLTEADWDDEAVIERLQP